MKWCMFGALQFLFIIQVNAKKNSNLTLPPFFKIEIVIKDRQKLQNFGNAVFVHLNL